MATLDFTPDPRRGFDQQMLRNQGFGGDRSFGPGNEIFRRAQARGTVNLPGGRTRKAGSSGSSASGLPPLGTFLAGNPTRNQFTDRIARQGNQIATGAAQHNPNDAIGQILRDLGFHTFGNLAGGLETQELALGNLARIIANEGRTDPATFNQNLARNALSTQLQQQAAREEATRTGMQRAVGSQGTIGAIGAAGSGREAALRAREADTMEARRRQDLDLVLQMLINPTLTGFGVERGVATNMARIDAAEGDKLLRVLGALTGGAANIAPFFPGRGGGGAE